MLADGGFDRVLDGLALAEGPCVDAAGALWCSSVLSGGVRRRGPDGAVAVLAGGRRGIGGLVPHRDGGVVMTGRDVRHLRPGAEDRVLLAAPAGVTGFNDLTTDAAGSVLVGALRHRPMAGEPAVDGEVWRIDAAGARVEAVVGPWPNGMAVRDDGTLLLADFGLAVVDAVRDGERRPFAAAPRGSCDGLALDADGGVWVALGQGGALARFTAGGELDGVVDVPAEFVSSLCFDGHDLYVTTGDGVLRARATVPGAPVTPAAI